MNIQVCLVSLFLLLHTAWSKTDLHPLSDEFINSINKAQSAWKAGRNFDINTPISYLTRLMGVDDTPPSRPVPVRNFRTASLLDLPDSFDAREQWPHCASLRHIRDQAACGSCWAVAAAAAMTDRLCIKSNGNITTSLSAANIMSCCTDFCGNGCKGGSIFGPWEYWTQHGIPSGGDYESEEGCSNYPFPSCASVPWSKKPKCGPERETPQCQESCQSKQLAYRDELTYATSAYYLQTKEEIKLDILEHGPIEAGFSVYEDFPSYMSGVYHHVKGKFLGKHAIKILGWGVENSIPYWLVANSWNEEWGDQGYFKIRRGNDECGIESMAFAGEPRV